MLSATGQAPDRLDFFMLLKFGRFLLQIGDVKSG